MRKGSKRLDHLVIGVAALEQGAEELERLLGINLDPGGQHQLMGTHNRLTALDASSYLEVIAIDPTATLSHAVRWFSLDQPSTQKRLALSAAPLTWVVAVDDLPSTMRKAEEHDAYPLGSKLDMQRGDLSWSLSLPDNPEMNEQGLLPQFIQWHGTKHPVQQLHKPKIRVDEIRISTPTPEHLQSLFDSLAIDHLATITAGEINLEFALDTPNGPVTIRSKPHDPSN